MKIRHLISIKKEMNPRNICYEITSYRALNGTRGAVAVLVVAVVLVAEI